MKEALRGQNVSRETADALRAFVDLVLHWTPRINLISASSVAEVWNRHIVDSAQLFPLAPQNLNLWADLGSGGGFPGVVMAILAKEHRPEANFILVESDQRKATFLRTASRTFGLRLTVLTDRIESLAPLGADVLSARALAPLDILLGYAALHLLPSGIALFPKGQTASEEIAVAQRNWSFQLSQSRSITNPNAAILRVESIARV